MKVSVLFAAAGLAVCLTACGPKQTDTIQKPATSESAAAEPTAAPTPTVPPTQAEPAAEVGTILPETPDAGRSYLDETLFIGDSNTVRYTMYADETGTAFASVNNSIGVVSMGVGSITTLKCEKFKGSSTMYTVPEAVAMLKPKRIIICYGTNNLAGSSTDATNYIKTYLQGLQAIQQAWPYCDIIVSAIPPLDKQRENTNLTMTQVDAYNAALVTMCEENGFKFLNSAEVLRDDATGWAKTDYTLSDGVHLSKDAVTAYFTYVRTHAYITEDRRPQPLGNIPQPDGVPANLITKDPIAVRGAKVPLEFVAENGGTLSGATSQLVKKGATAAAVTAVPDAGFVFAGWTASSGGSYSGATIGFTMPQNADAGGVVLTAHFTADAHEHNYVEIEDTRVNPTCTNNGTAKYKCTICGEIVEKELQALGHDWDDGVRNGDEIIYYCRREGCDATKTEESQHTHTYDAGVVTREATCGEPGVLTRTCTICGQQTEEQIPATGQHNWQQTEHVDAQVGVEGYNVYTCAVCSQTYRETIPALEPTSDPVTPDPAPADPVVPDAPTEPAPEQPEVTTEPTTEG
ncbi:GDSL-type esterase/lipase family protein [Gemmiger sp.]